MTGVSDDRAVFEETLRLIVRPPLVWRARGGYAFRFGGYNQHSIGLVADVLNVPKRDESTTLRVGPVMRFVLSRRVELRGSFVMTLVSPDNIGLVGGDFTELGVRYRWASSDPDSRRRAENFQLETSQPRARVDFRRRVR